MDADRRRRSARPRAWAVALRDRDRDAARRRLLNVYVDSSALVAVLARESTSVDVEYLMETAASRYASLLTYVETRAALAARRRASARARLRVARTRSELADRWEEIDVVQFDELVADVAGLAAEQHRLHGADAVHLASAAVLGSGVTMLSLDERLREASLAVGLDVAP